MHLMQLSDVTVARRVELLLQSEEIDQDLVARLRGGPGTNRMQMVSACSEPFFDGSRFAVRKQIGEIVELVL